MLWILKIARLLSHYGRRRRARAHPKRTLRATFPWYGRPWRGESDVQGPAIPKVPSLDQGPALPVRYWGASAMPGSAFAHRQAADAVTISKAPICCVAEGTSEGNHELQFQWLAT